MAKLADAADLKSADRKVVGVQVPLRAPIKSITYGIFTKPADVRLDAGDTYGDTLYLLISGGRNAS